MKTEILKYVCYFDIFNHPLRQDELKKLSGIKGDDFKESLIALLDEKKCFEYKRYYALKENVQELVEIRNEKEKEAQYYFKKLPFYAKLIRSFPFVSGIGISGSLSKNVMHEDGDIDYFIITKPNRLWICRTFLVAFKKVFLFNSKKYFCVNYFVDENNLMIPDKNIFTAIETTHLIPVYNYKLIAKFKTANNWTDDYLTGFEHPIKLKEVTGKSWLGKFIEFIFKGKLGDRLDFYLMRFTYRKWEKKFKHFDTSKFDLTMRTNRGVSKHHPRDFQNKVLGEYEARLNQLNIEK